MQIQKQPATQVQQPNDSKQEQPDNTENTFCLLEDQIKKVRYPTYAISSAQNLSQKIKRFKNKKISEQLRDKLKGFNSYRQVRGDGNCFFRALAFSYIRILGKIRLEQIFCRICQISLTTCNYDTIPKDFVKFYEPKFLRNMLEKYWQKNYQEEMKINENNSYKGLIMLFDKYPFLDFIVILYFRSLCLLTLNENRGNFQDYLTGNEEDCIKNYSEETEGILINLCSKMTKLVINVYEIRADQMKYYHYDVEEHIGEIHLLFYENHYDIIEYNELIKEEQNSLMSKQFYGQVNKSMQKGICVQCGIHSDVYKQSLICQKCESKVEDQLKQFEETKMIRGKCGQCGYKTDIYQAFGLCKLCFDKAKRKEQLDIKKKELQVEWEKKEKEIEEKQTLRIYWQRNSTYEYCKGCKAYKRVDKETNMCRKCIENNVQILPKQEQNKLIFANCLECFKRCQLNPDIGICRRCTENQKIVLEKNEKKRENIRNHSVAVDKSSVFGVNKYGKESLYGTSKFGIYQNEYKNDMLKIKQNNHKNKDQNRQKVSQEYSQYQLKSEQIPKIKNMTEDKKEGISSQYFDQKFLQQSIKQKTKVRDINDEYNVDRKQNLVGDPSSAFSQKKKAKMINCKRCEVQFYPQLSVYAQKFLCKKCYFIEDNPKINRDKLEEQRKQRILLKGNNKNEQSNGMRNKTEEFGYLNSFKQRKKQQQENYYQKQNKNDLQFDSFRKQQLAILQKKERPNDYAKSPKTYQCEKCSQTVLQGKNLCSSCFEAEEKMCRTCRKSLAYSKYDKQCSYCHFKEKEKNPVTRSLTTSKNSIGSTTGSIIKKYKI